jgi:branched-chain amino acid transport system substrate-binding protein
MGPARRNVDGRLEIGVLLPTSGPAADIGASMNAGVQLAAAEINAVGGVLGRPVSVVARDEGANATTAAASLHKLLYDDNVDAVVGPLSSRVALAGIDAVVGAKAVMCSPGATSIALSSYPNGGYFVRTMPSDALQAVALGDEISHTGLPSTAIITSDDDYGRGVASALSKELARQNTTVTAVTPYDPTADDMTSEVRDALSGNPRAIAVIGGPDSGGKVLHDLMALGVSPARTPIFVSDGMRSPGLFGTVQADHPESVAGIQGTSPAVQPDGEAWFGRDFDAFAPGTANVYAGYAYDCVNLIALASQIAGTDDAGVYRTRLAPATRIGISCRNFGECLGPVDAGLRIDLEGATGQMWLLDNGDRRYGAYDVFHFAPDGKDQTVRQTEAITS